MRSLLVSAAMAALISTSAVAATANDNAPANPAVKTNEGNNPGAPAAGANSFTEGQAKSRIEAKGYVNITGLEKDSRGIWRGKGNLQDGRLVHVTLDLEGNIYSELYRTVIEIRRLRGPRNPLETPN